MTVTATSPPWDLPHSVMCCWHLLDVAEARGIDPAACLTGTDLTTEAIADPGTLVQTQHELTIIRNLLELNGVAADLAIDAGRRYNLAHTGTLGYAVLASTTVRRALAAITRYAVLSGTFLTLRRHDHGGDVTLEFDSSEIPPDVRAFILQRDMVALSRLTPLLRPLSTPGAAAPRLELPGIRLPDDLVRKSGLCVDTDAARAALVVPRGMLAQPMPAADPQTELRCLTHCEQLLNNRYRQRGLSAWIRSRLVDDLARFPGMSTVAAELGVTERTLHRRLASENTTFRALVGELRERLAEKYLCSGHTVEDTAQLLGYSDPVAFTHAYVRWSGHPPRRGTRQGVEP